MSTTPPTSRPHPAPGPHPVTTSTTVSGSLTARALVIGAVTGALVAATPFLARVAGEDLLATAYGVIAGAGIVLLLVAVLAPGGRRIAPLAVLAWYGVILVLTVGGAAVLSTAPHSAAVLLAAFLGAGGLAAGLAALALRAQAKHAVSRASAQAALRAELADRAASDAPGSSDGLDGSGDPEGVREPGTGEEGGGAYSALDALADIDAGRAGLAERATEPGWYYPVVGVALAVVALLIGLHAPTPLLLGGSLLAFGMIVWAIRRYQAVTGIVVWRVYGGRALPWFLAYIGAVVAGFVLVQVAASTGNALLVITGTTVLLVGVIVAGRGYDRASRAQMRAGGGGSR